METSGPSSPSQDTSRVHRGSEDVDCAGRGELDVVKDELQLSGDAAGEMVLSGESGLGKRGSVSASGEAEASQLRRLNIKKDDEFFHFVLLCFAIGALLVCYHYYAGKDPGEGLHGEVWGQGIPACRLTILSLTALPDWFMSLGVGLLTFASLETVGIYFGLVYRIHSVLQGFIPLFQKLRMLGSRKTD
uniref:Transmembrane protein 40 isoform X6 n=1 Tax=Castor canadensis TaxID=51338 RepID=A0A8B7VLC7_CASCN|nr:transmembrane protein 40 isoform X6 [Castor canadensis]